MGNFYKNLCLLGPGQSDVAAALERHGRVAFVTPQENRMTVAFDLESDEIGDPGELGDLALTLSQDLACPVLAAAVYDDDVLLLGLYDHGKQIGEYNSSGPSNLRPSALTKAFERRKHLRVWLLLRAPRFPFFIFESLRHSLLLRALGAPQWAYATGYGYLQRGERPAGLSDSQLIHVGTPRPFSPKPWKG
jgi:hypothetical protein